MSFVHTSSSLMCTRENFPVGHPSQIALSQTRLTTLSSLMRTRENFLVGHPSQIALSQTRLTWRFFRDRLPKNKMHLVGMITLLILLSLGPDITIHRVQDITIHPLRRLTSSSVNPKPRTSSLGHVCVFNVVICHYHVTTPGPYAPCTICLNP